MFAYRPVMGRACYAAEANTDECTFLGTGDQLQVGFLQRVSGLRRHCKDI